MLRLRCCVLTQLLSFPPASPASQIHRLISAAAPAVSPNPSFAVEEYLVATCSLSRAQALKASTKLSHLKSPAKPDAVLSFLAGHGFSSSDVAAVVAGDPKVLCSSVEGYLGPVVAQLTGLGLSRSQIARLISYCHGNLHLTSIVSKLQYYLPFFGSIDNTLLALKRCLYLISSDLERVVKPNVAALRDSGLGDCDIAKLCVPNPRLLTTNVESIRAMVSCAESLGVPRGSRMFRHAMSAVVFLSEEKIAPKVGYLKKTFRWSDAEVGIAVSKHPILLRRSKDSLRSSLEGRLRPRYYVVKFLKENELLHCERDYYASVMISEKVFMEKFICPHKEAAPHLADDYLDACRGQVPTRLRYGV